MSSSNKPGHLPYLWEYLQSQADHNPEAIAVVCQGQALSYGEIHRQSNQLGWYLRKIGIDAETRVGVCLPRSPALMIAILSIWKAGGVYIPLDPAYPEERLAFMVEDAQLAALLTDSQMLDGLAANWGRTVCLDREWGAIRQETTENPPVRTFPESLAYVMYTSGSTGKPKGAMIEHRGMMNHLWAKVEDLGLSNSDIVAQNAPSSFDVSIWQMMAALLAGAQVQIIDEEIARDAETLLASVQRLGITVLQTVPTLLGIMIDQQEQAGEQRLSLQKLRWMISNAEALPRSMCDQWARLYPQVPLLNAYGPTECSDDIAHYVVEQVSDAQWTYAALGSPLRNMKSYVLDGWMRQVPIGMTGEMYIGGVGVGRGYLNRPDLTAERFVPNPFSQEPGARLYRTGDSVRRLAGGKADFVGRLDNQVKLRGLRIELTEIEAVLNQHESVLRSVAIVREDEPGDQRLVAYVVGKHQVAIDTDELRSSLKGRLPEYMVPGAIVVLERMPLTVNEKIDRTALPKPERAIAEASCYVQPRHKLDEKVAAIWADALKVPRIGIHDNFFVLGGHSLLATRIVSRMRNELEIDLTLRMLFEKPTVAAMSDAIEQLKHLPGKPGAQPGARIERSTQPVEDEIVTQLDQLSEEEIDQLINKM
jgi:amino acid adenylation domain-containing protein